MTIPLSAASLLRWASIAMTRTFSGRSAWVWACVAFAVCIAPTFISYQTYFFRWDEADYLTRAIVASRGFWSADPHRVLAAMVGIRPPAMTWLGIPWGALLSWDAAGECFLTLAAVTAVLAAFSLYLLLRIGTDSVALAVASCCVFASLGPFPAGATAHAWSTGFMSDGILAWASLAAVLLIPYEARIRSATPARALMRGIVWGLVLSLGTMTKLNFLYFVVLVVPVLVIVKSRFESPRHTVAAFLGFAIASVPATWYLIRFGQPAFQNMKDSSFGSISGLFYVPFLQFAGSTIRESPGLALLVVFVIAAVIYLVATKQRPRWPDAAAFLIMLLFCAIVLAAPNRQIRYAFPGIVALPFLASVLISRSASSVSSRAALLACAIVFAGMTVAAVPMRSRPSPESIARSKEVFAFAMQHRAVNVVIATDSPTLNGPLVELTRTIMNRPLPRCETLAYSIMYGVPIQNDIGSIRDADVVIFQDRQALFPPYTNARVPEYEDYVRKIADGPIKVGADMNAYFVRHERSKQQ